MVIGVGNLSLGGNGKTPLVEYLIRLMKDQYRVAVVSRGYKRHTQGYRLVGEIDDPGSVGDEPYQIFTKYGSQVKVAVGEQRALAIPSLLLEYPELEVIILDDAFQHRSVVPQLNILVTDFHRPFFRDFALPVGRLREIRSGASRADVIMVTKCPEQLKSKIKHQYQKEITRYAGDKPVFFSYVQYDKVLPVWSGIDLSSKTCVLLVTGIANAQPMFNQVSRDFHQVEHLKFGDHYQYKERDVKRIIERHKQLEADKKIILTTEKDMVKLKLFRKQLSHLPVYYQPIKFQTLEDSGLFNRMVLEKVKSVYHEVH